MNIDIKCNVCGAVMYQCGFRRDGIMAVDPCPCQKDLMERLACSLEQLACWARNNSRTGKWDNEEDIKEMLSPVWDLIEEAFPKEHKDD